MCLNTIHSSVVSCTLRNESCHAIHDTTLYISVSSYCITPIFLLFSVTREYNYRLVNVTLWCICLSQGENILKLTVDKYNWDNYKFLNSRIGNIWLPNTFASNVLLDNLWFLFFYFKLQAFLTMYRNSTKSQQIYVNLSHFQIWTTKS